MSLMIWNFQSLKTELVRNDLDVARRAEEVEADAELEGIDVDEAVKEFKMVKDKLRKEELAYYANLGFHQNMFYRAGYQDGLEDGEPSSAHHVT